ncbi:PAS domain-containing protein [Natronosalvus halobius]|uniref:PAS domain-containing protein n=1 Tax=Natronosalvus halobius TaxID=2953746 RepID=UPI0020A0BF49|nr:PAS domain S-box protein [Natronosalvus halobius]USZ71085.1 PAS domain S-box protein [Natronosalvus halobius]
MGERGLTTKNSFLDSTDIDTSLRRYRTILDTIDDGLFHLDAEGRVVDGDDDFIETIGCDRADIRDEHVSTLFDEGASTLEREIERLRTAPPSGPQSDLLECTVETDSGNQLLCEVRVDPIVEDDTVEGIVGIVRDVTEQRERERFLDDAKSQLEAATEAGAVGTWEWNIPEDEFTTSSWFAEKFGADPDAVQEGVSLDDIVAGIHEDDRERVENAIEAAIEDRGEYEEEYRVWNADGELRWVVARGHVESDEEGNPTTFPGALIDITERRAAQRELRESEAKLRVLAENVDEVVWMASADGSEFVYINPAYEDVWGRDRESLYDDPMSFLEAIHPDDRERVREAFAALPEEAYDEEYRVVQPDGEVRWVHAQGGSVRTADDDLNRIVGTAKDVTALKERERKLEETVEKLEQSNDRLESLASMIAHELRNPVAIGQIYANQLPAEADSDAVEYVDEAFDRIETMIDVLLVLTHGRTSVGDREPVSLATAARDAWDEVNAPDATTRISLEGEIRGDETYIQHLFRNLFENAVLHGGPDVTVQVERAPEGFFVADDGPGFSVDDPETAFEAGFTTAEEHGGTGLGLAFVRELAEVYGWTCEIGESDEGGARIDFLDVDFSSSESDP